MKNLVNENTYWIALSHLPNWKKEKINQLIIKIFDEEKISLEDFFNASKTDWTNKFQLSKKEIADLENVKNELSVYSTLAEKLQSQKIEIIPINSSEYSTTLKENLKIKYSPSILYIKGNKTILQEDSIAIVGSRNASEIALEFTDNIAKLKLESNNYKVVVSGFAKGVDRQALNSAINYNGHSIIVLPQGIMTFSSEFKKYSEQIEEGNLLVLSIFHPEAVWSVGLAMARNPIIYGLAKEIFVAEANEKGGTWAGVKDGLNKGRKIYVRNPEPSENNANQKLIKKEGVIGVDFNGEPIKSEEIKQKQLITREPDQLNLFS